MTDFSNELINKVLDNEISIAEALELARAEMIEEIKQYRDNNGNLDELEVGVINDLISKLSDKEQKRR